MCGIFGYVGKNKESPEIVFEGLKLLEYRGYDSWGIAAKVTKSFPNKESEGGSKFAVEKHVGKIGDHAIKPRITTLESNLAIGHTRWATHGGVTVQNAHPQMDCAYGIAVVHNGIVENFGELKKELVSEGHKFVSQTDTEVIAHLIEKNLKIM